MDSTATHFPSPSAGSMNSRDSAAYPPSLYDTSVSSASGGRSSGAAPRRTPVPSSAGGGGGTPPSGDHSAPPLPSSPSSAFLPRNSPPGHSRPRLRQYYQDRSLGFQTQQQLPQHDPRHRSVVAYPSPRTSRSMDYAEQHGHRAASDPGGPSSFSPPKIGYAQSDVVLAPTSTAAAKAAAKATAGRTASARNAPAMSHSHRPPSPFGHASSSHLGHQERHDAPHRSVPHPRRAPPPELLRPPPRTTSSSTGGNAVNTSGCTDESIATDTTFRFVGSSSHNVSPRYNSYHNSNDHLNRSYETISSSSRSQNRDVASDEVGHTTRRRASPPPSASVKERRRQLWNENEVLQVAVPPSLSYGSTSGGGDYQSDSELHHPRQHSRPSCPSGSNSQRDSSHYVGTRFARSLSPGRARLPQAPPTSSQYSDERHGQQSSPQPSTVPPAGSTVSESSSSVGKFHSKFYEAALVARMRGKVTPPLSPTSPRRQMTAQFPHGQRQQQQDPQRHGHAEEGLSIQDPRETFVRPPSTRRVSDPNRALIHQQHREQEQKQPERQQPLLSPEDVDGKFSPHSATDARSRGRSMEPPPRRYGRDGNYNSSHGGRLPSPMIQERIRSLSQEPSSSQRLQQPFPSSAASDVDSREHPPHQQHGNHHPYRYNGVVADGRKAGRDSPNNDPRNDSFDAVIGMDESDVSNVSRQATTAQGSKFYSSGTDRGASYPQPQWRTPPLIVPQPPTTPTSVASSSPIDSLDSGYRRTIGLQHGYSSPSGGSDMQHEREAQKAHHVKNVSNLVAKLHAVRRDDPEEALKQIDSILRQESRGSSSADDILRGGESNRFHSLIRESPADGVNDAPDDEAAEDNDILDGDDDDETSAVSSITNPTYQESSKPYSATVRVVTLNDGNGSDSKNHTSFNIDVGNSFQDPEAKLAFPPSTSSFRRPRPSYLQNYAMPASSPDNVVMASRSELKRQQLKEFPPPTSIAVKEGKVSSPGARGVFYYSESDMEDAENSILTEEKKSSESERTPANARDGRVAGKFDSQQIVPERKLDSFISNKQAQEALAEKIRVWDDLSNGVSRSTFEKVPDGHQLGRSSEDHALNSKTSSKRHPWDARMRSRGDPVQVRSLDLATGDESEMFTRDSRSMMNNNKARATIDSPHASSSEAQGNHFQDGRSRIKERAEEYVTIDPTYHVDDKAMSELPRIPDIALLDETMDSETSDNLMPTVTKSLEGIAQFSPNLAFAPPDQQQTVDQKVTANETKNGDNAWIEMPPSSFFPDVNENLEPVKSMSPSRCSSFTNSTPFFPKRKDRNTKSSRNEHVVNNEPVCFTRSSSLKQRSGRPNSGPVDLDTSMDASPHVSFQGSQPRQGDANRLTNTSAEQGEIEVSLSDGNNVAGEGVAEPRSKTRSLNCATNGQNKDAKPKERRKGFLRALIERKKKKGSVSLGYAASTGSVAAFSNSHESRAAKSASHVDRVAQTPNSAGRPQTTIRLLPPPPGVLDQRNITPTRGRNSSSRNPPSRTRSNDLERFRNPSMAKKFSRVMKVYDNEV